MTQHYYAMATSNGAIQQTISGPYLYIACDDDVSDTTHFVDVDAGDIRPKRPLEISYWTDGMTVTLDALPGGLAVSSNNKSAVTDDDPLVITYDVPGTYEITLKGHVEYLDQTLEVTVGDP